ncbi:Oidioi.mRNA.OKI2018_I69.XSR.g14337.t1.cds [Oikopleura dioica]|uniref:Oidioi.mRNA.OKI2018_I69.XSR.g14337.t1.cds n=1 Tax=Oikopleura dioica TaxID=34765 RepID=A0ABN7SER7_OIKDI|nr:Oidioi.mRNA.OKI2018_I69.XSR.g14337.t1.cds [Oikopleura dioica]
MKSSKKDRSVLPPLKVFPVASEDQTNAPGVAIGCQNSPLARRKPQSRLQNNILPSKPWNTRDMLANLPNISGDRADDFDAYREARGYQVGPNSRPNSRPQSPAMGVRETLELGSPRRPLSRRSRSSSLDSFSEELLGLSGGNSENEHLSIRPCVYTPQDGRVPPRPPSIDASDLINCLNSEVYFYNEEETSDFDSRTGSLENSPPGRIMPPSPASNKTYKFGKAPPNDRVLLALRSYDSLAHDAAFPQMVDEDTTEKRYPLTHSENSNFSRPCTNESDSIEY